MCYNYIGDNMGILNIAIVLFIIIELSNVIILYFKPDFKYGNGVGVFKDFLETKGTSKILIDYLTNWVAGVKLIFIAQLFVVLFFNNLLLKQMTVLVIIFSVLTYFFRLHKIIKKLDKMGRLKVKGYSKTLDMMIISIILVFTVALVLSTGII